MMAEYRKKIWIIDDHQLFRAGFRTLLSRLSNVSVTFEGSDGSDFLDNIDRGERPDLVFLDISMPNIDGIKATKEALARDPDMCIVILSMFGEHEYYTKLVDLGVRGFLLKSCDFKEVEKAIVTILGGDFYFSPELIEQMAFKDTSQVNSNNADELSDRERDVLTLVCSGASSQEIADKLFISRRTVEKHRASIMMKTGSANTASLVVYAVRNGLYEI